MATRRTDSRECRRLDAAYARRPRRIAAVVSLATLLLAATHTQAQAQAADAVAQALALLQAGRAADSLALLAPLAAQHAGEADFDRALGLALLQTGHAGRAAMVLERAVARQPQVAETRLLLATAYMAEGDDASADRELKLLSASSPPAPAQARIEQMQAAIAARRARQGVRSAIDLGMTAGHDDNANAGTDSASFLGFTLAPEARRAPSAFVDGRAAATRSAPLAPRWRWSADARGRHREYLSFDPASRSDVDAGLGLRFEQRQFLASSGLSGGYTWLGGSGNHRRLAWDGALSAAIGSDRSLALRLRAAALRYSAELASHDVDQWIGSLQFGARIAGPLQAHVAVLGGRERGAGDDAGFGRTLAGLRAGATGAARPWRIEAGGLWSDYERPFFGAPRQDRQWDVTLGLDWPLARKVVAAPYARYAHNDSSVALYTYDRLEFGIAMSWSPP